MQGTDQIPMKPEQNKNNRKHLPSFLLCFGVNTQGLLLALHSGVTQCSRTIWDVRDQSLLGHLQGKHPICCFIATYQPQFQVFWFSVWTLSSDDPTGSAFLALTPTVSPKQLWWAQLLFYCSIL